MLFGHCERLVENLLKPTTIGHRQRDARLQHALEIIDRIVCFNLHCPFLVSILTLIADLSLISRRLSVCVLDFGLPPPLLLRHSSRLKGSERASANARQRSIIRKWDRLERPDLRCTGRHQREGQASGTEGKPFSSSSSRDSEKKKQDGSPVRPYAPIQSTMLGGL